MSLARNPICQTIAIACCMAIGQMPTAIQAQSVDPLFMIGSQAPDLDIEHWFSDGEGRYPHTTSFEKGNIYVLEFWSTWSKPGVRAMPRMAELQKKYADQNVQIISISDEEVYMVEIFLARTIPGNEKKLTYADLTAAYCLTTDPDKSAKRDYFRATKQFRLPCVFLIGRTGLIEWIGPTKDLEEPLDLLIQDRWDRESFEKKYNAIQEARFKRTSQNRKKAKALMKIDEAIARNKPEEAVQMLNELIQNQELAQSRSSFQEQRCKLMVANNLPGADIAFAEFVDQNRNNGTVLNSEAWSIYTNYVNNGNISRKLLEQAKRASKFSNVASPNNGAFLDTLAHLMHALDEDLDSAIEIQKEASRLSPTSSGIQRFLQQLQFEKASGKRPPTVSPNKQKSL